MVDSMGVADVLVGVGAIWSTLEDPALAECEEEFVPVAVHRRQ